MKLTAQELEQMKSVDIGAVSADALADVSGVGVKIEFAEGGPSLQETLAAFLIRQKSGL